MSDELAQCCTWAAQEDGEFWNASCGHDFTVIDGDTPTAHEMRFCCFCGKRLVEVMFVEPEDTDE